MGGTRSMRKSGQKKNSGKKNTRKKETSVKQSNFHKKYNEYVTKLSNKLDIEPAEASSHLGTAMQNAFNGLMLSKIPYDEYYSLKEDELQSVLHPSTGATKKRKKKRCKSCGASGTMSKINRSRGKCSKGKCKKCGKMKLPLSILRKMRSIRKPGNKRTFHLTPKSLRHDNIKTNMSGFSETRICESHNGSPLKCRTMRKKY